MGKNVSSGTTSISTHIEEGGGENGGMERREGENGDHTEIQGEDFEERGDKMEIERRSDSRDKIRKREWRQCRDTRKRC